MKQPKIAIVTDWITSFGGQMRVDLALHHLFPDAPIFTSVYEPENNELSGKWRGADIRTTWLQRLPKFLRRLHKLFPTLRVRAFRGLDLSDFDIIISSSSAEAKHVRKTRDDQIHLCYCHTPTRYYWSHYDEYRQHPSFGKLDFLIRPFIPLLVPSMRRKDFKAAQAVDQFIANSTEVQKRIKQYYKKDSVVIFPPVDTERFVSVSAAKKRRGLLAVGRQVPYKRVDLAVAAANELDMELAVYGRGSEHEKLAAAAGSTVQFFTDADDNAIARAFADAKYFIFPSEEDFGIVQVESLAAGTPVIAFDKGGVRDIISDGKTGVLFSKQTAVAVADAIKRADTISFDKKLLQKTAAKFDEAAFNKAVLKLVDRYRA